MPRRRGAIDRSQQGHGRRPQHPGRPVQPSPWDRVGPAQLPERQRQRLRSHSKRHASEPQRHDSTHHIWAEYSNHSNRTVSHSDSGSGLAVGPKEDSVAELPGDYDIVLSYARTDEQNH
jgi:hypothetical protein